MKIVPVEHDIFHQYPGQTAPQRVQVEIDLENGTITIDYDRVIGSGCSERVWHSREYQLKMPGNGYRKETLNLLLQEILPFAEKMEEQFFTERNDQTALIGYLTEEGENAKQQIKEIISNVEGDLQVWEATDFFLCNSSMHKLCAEFQVTAQTDELELTERLKVAAKASSECDVLIAVESLARSMIQFAADHL